MATNKTFNTVNPVVDFFQQIFNIFIYNLGSVGITHVTKVYMLPIGEKFILIHYTLVMLLLMNVSVQP